MQSACIAFALAAVAATLHGCGGGGSGGGGGGNHTKGPPPAVPSGPTLPLRPLRSLSYSSLPNRDYKLADPLPAQDMMQEGYAAQWGPDGRDDLGLMKTLGANAVRLYHSLGIEGQHDHGAFLDRAKDIGIHVLPGFHTQMQDQCEGFNCFNYWKQATLDALDKGFMIQKNKTWHPAVSILVLLEEPDAAVTATIQTCDDPKHPNRCWIRAVLSAMDGVLAAEKERGVKNGTVNFTASWSFAKLTSADGTVTGPGFFGFQDIVLGANDPWKYAGYKPVVGLDAVADAFRTRWTHSMSAEVDPESLQTNVFDKLKSLSAVKSTPWFISSFRSEQPLKTTDKLKQEIEFLDSEAKKGGAFLGVSIYQFQKSYQDAHDDNGLFRLGSAAGPVGNTTQVCHEDIKTKAPVCKEWPVYCLNEDKAVSGYADVAAVLAAAWDGTVKGRALCRASLSSELKQLVV
jgi:hypothetical protein